VDACRSRARVGSATLSTVVSRPTARVLTDSAASANQRDLKVTII
jgi:hypothetical protein